MSVLKFLKSIDRSAMLRAVAIATVLLITLNIAGFDSKCTEIRENVLRLHVLANSDEAYDQELKLKVRDRLLEVSGEVFSGCKTETEAAEAARQKLSYLQSVAESTVRENGYGYTVAVEVADTWFETRDYGEFSLPAGNYEALRVIIGEGKGKNWWCVMFPAVCIPAATDRESDFSSVLEDGSADIVEKPSRYKPQFKVVEIFEKVSRKLGSWF